MLENSIETSVTYVGPLPPANDFSKYEQTLPGAAHRILTLAEQEAEHRRKNENKLIDESISLGRKGQIFAFIIALVSLGIVCTSFFFSQPFAAIAPAIIAFTSLASIFVGKHTSK
ncbi:hypothetical protein AGMMS49938_11250 [Fibrobacterales bacterium]|nr:hypothetical protein AGMMS49938_11250 [Fibrobacterales bacterium]